MCDAFVLIIIDERERIFDKILSSENVVSGTAVDDTDALTLFFCDAAT